MADKVQEVEETTVQDGQPVQTSRRVTTARADGEGINNGSNTGATVERLVYFITGLLLSLLAIRFILSLLGANRENGFADLIYGITYPFVSPFFGLFGYEVEYGVARFEIETLVAMIIYGLIGYGIAKLIRIARKA